MRQIRENDTGQRALQSMMGGTLKTKKDLSALEITLEREPWMDEPFESLSEIQQDLLREFEEKSKNLESEKEKYRKQLDADMQKQKKEVEDLKSSFAEKLKQLHHSRYKIDIDIFSQELYCIRLNLTILQSNEDEDSALVPRMSRVFRTLAKFQISKLITP